MGKGYRVEHDSMGALKVPVDALYGAQTQRAVDNFPISNLKMPRAFIQALGLIKAAAARMNAQLGLLPPEIAEAIALAAGKVANGDFDTHFPVDVFQTGSGTSSNMNANEVIAHLASEQMGKPVHPNDHVNMGQSSNDVIPTAIHLSASVVLNNSLLPAFEHLQTVIEEKGLSLASVVTTGRTHLMDAMPITLGQALSGWAAQVKLVRERLQDVQARLNALAQGGTAVGTGINAHPDFGAGVARLLSQETGLPFTQADNLFAGLSSQDTAVELSGVLNTAAVALMKIANDLRWMNAGPLAGIGEIALPALQPGSSIMPGKINPVIPEAVCMVAAQVMGNHTTITVAGQAGNFQLNVMLPVIAYNLLQGLELTSNASRLLADNAIAGFTVNEAHMQHALAKNPILVTALNPIIGYEQGAAIAKRAYAEGRSIISVALEMTDLDEAELQRLLDPLSMTRGGIAK
ncbi:MAG: class II fumarate hydratase [Gammaproteobacteria bacterium]|nr:MAG: class II fumarate hydratase [Gammaproteobacteria bacterium]